MASWRHAQLSNFRDRVGTLISRLSSASRLLRGDPKGESATARHAWDEADDALRRALTIAEAIGQPRQTWLSQLAVGRLDSARGRRDGALGRYRAAWAIISGLRAATRDPGLRAGLESSPLICEVEDLARR